ncbi:MAG TPA: ABC transporter ATP-binding protein [Chitinophagaceae bacterium]|nr:ABC transporter ATP-binding protein [Chitinophagaceae bacterium]
MEFLQVKNISRQENGNPAAREIRFVQQHHQKIAIAGETGSGKSTLLKIIAGLAQAESGEVRFEGVRVEGPAEKLIPGHPGIAYLSQQYELPNNMWVEEVLSYADELPPGEAAILYATCRIDHLLKRRTNQLSGGEKQRIALARLLTRSPKLLLLDEPFSNLDLIHKRILKTVIKDIGDKLGTTCMLASHDPLDTLSWADEIIVIREGQIIQQGPPAIVYSQPLNEYVAGLFGAYNLIPASSVAAFEKLSGIKQNGKSLFFRPEDIKVMKKKGHTAAGIVTGISFMGGYYEAGISVNGVDLIARMMEQELTVGEEVEISLNAKKVWEW